VLVFLFVSCFPHRLPEFRENIFVEYRWFFGALEIFTVALYGLNFPRDILAFFSEALSCSEPNRGGSRHGGGHPEEAVPGPTQGHHLEVGRRGGPGPSERTSLGKRASRDSRALFQDITWENGVDLVPYIGNFLKGHVGEF